MDDLSGISSRNATGRLTQNMNNMKEPNAAASSMQTSAKASSAISPQTGNAFRAWAGIRSLPRQRDGARPARSPGRSRYLRFAPFVRQHSVVVLEQVLVPWHPREVVQQFADALLARSCFL